VCVCEEREVYKTGAVAWHHDADEAHLGKDLLRIVHSRHLLLELLCRCHTIHS
jgi:hypothetical protein